MSPNNDGQNKIRSRITIKGYDASKKVTNVDFSNIHIGGTCITSNDNLYFDFNQHVEDVTVVAQ